MDYTDIQIEERIQKVKEIVGFEEDDDDFDLILEFLMEKSKLIMINIGDDFFELVKEINLLNDEIDKKESIIQLDNEYIFKNHTDLIAFSIKTNDEFPLAEYFDDFKVIIEKNRKKNNEIKEVIEKIENDIEKIQFKVLFYHTDEQLKQLKKFKNVN